MAANRHVICRYSNCRNGTPGSIDGGVSQSLVMEANKEI